VPAHFFKVIIGDKPGRFGKPVAAASWLAYSASSL